MRAFLFLFLSLSLRVRLYSRDAQLSSCVPTVSQRRHSLWPHELQARQLPYNIAHAPCLCVCVCVQSSSWAASGGPHYPELWPVVLSLWCIFPDARDTIVHPSHLILSVCCLRPPLLVQGRRPASWSLGRVGELVIRSLAQRIPSTSVLGGLL